MPAALAIARGLHMAGCFLLFGTSGLATVLLPPNWRQDLQKPLRFMAWSGFAILLIAGVAWFILESASMVGAETLSDVWSALPIVASSTRFGELLIGRSLALMAAVLFFQFGLSRIAAIFAGLALAAEAWLGHGGAMTGAIGTILLIASICHLLSGGVWLGSLPALWLAIKRLPLKEAGEMAWRFSPIGIACVIGLIASSSAQYAFLIGTPRSLLNNGYGLLASFKIVLLLGLLALATLNRQKLTPALLAGDESARRVLLRSVQMEVALGLFVLLAAGLLLQLTPPSMALMLHQQGGS